MSIRIPRTWRCAPLLQSRLGKADAEELAGIFKAIADPARLRLLSLIAAQPSGEACVCHFMKPLGLSQPTVSHHLRILHEAGLLARERRASWVYYRIVPERMSALRDVLAFAPEEPHRKPRALHEVRAR
jgi:ArsR family transcriptional regulator, arsenate/arsenite/antimonite-responsive transcriptional repressor